MDATDEAAADSGTTAISADDMLAQLAGDDIDRMLAEAEAESPPPITPAPQFRRATDAPANAPRAPAAGATLDSRSASIDDPLDHAARGGVGEPPAKSNAGAAPTASGAAGSRTDPAGLLKNRDDLRGEAGPMAVEKAARKSETPDAEKKPDSDAFALDLNPTAASVDDRLDEVEASAAEGSSQESTIAAELEEPRADDAALDLDTLSPSLDDLLKAAAPTIARKLPPLPGAATAAPDAASAEASRLEKNALSGSLDETLNEAPATETAVAANTEEAATAAVRGAVQSGEESPEGSSTSSPGGAPDSAAQTPDSTARTPVAPAHGTSTETSEMAAVPSAVTSGENSGDNVPLPFFLRFLNVIFAPLESIPDAVRDAIGKVAVVTLINSVGVLFYVLVIRHHHHR